MVVGFFLSLSCPQSRTLFVFLKHHLSLHLTNKAIKSLRQEALSSSLDIAPGVHVT